MSLNTFEVIEWTQNIAANKQWGIIRSELKVGLQLFFSVHCLIIHYICTKFHEIILNGFKVIAQTQNIARNKQWGIIMSELKVGLRFFFSEHCLIVPYICKKKIMKKS